MAEYSPGDLLDKCSILEIKKNKGLNVLSEYSIIKDEVVKRYFILPEIEKLYKALVDSNLEQFDLEDLIRVEKNLERVGEIALKIREFNDRRVNYKNIINKLSGESFPEIKSYKRTV